MNPFDDDLPKPSLKRSALRQQEPVDAGNDGLSVGVVRTHFSQLRSTSDLSVDTTLFSGESAGSFCTRYLLSILKR